MTSERRGWLSSLAVPALLVLVMSAATFVLVTRFTELLDPADSSLRLSEMNRFHTGPPPCLRYPADPTPGSAELAAEALAAAGVRRNDLSEIMGDVYARAEAREASAHQKSSTDEYLELMAERNGLLGRAALLIKRDLYREKLAHLGALRPPITRTIASLSVPARAEFEAQWARDPSLFVLPGLIRLLDQLAVTATLRRLDTVRAKLEQSGESTLDGLSADDRKDEWGTDLELEPASEDGLTLTSLGHDRFPGGTGMDADLQRIVHVARKTVLEPEVAPAFACEGRTSVRLKRKELDATLADMNGTARLARVTASFTDGVVTGFKLTHLQAHSIFAHAGLCEGDVLTAVNGVAINTPDNALQVYTTLRNASHVELRLVRAGVPTKVMVKLE